MSRVGSLASGVSGSSEGWSAIPLAAAVTKPWFEITVPLATFRFTTTSNVMVAVAPAGMEPAVVSAGELIDIPFTSGDMPAASATAAPFSFVLPATYAVFAGTASRNVTFTALLLVVFFIVIV